MLALVYFPRRVTCQLTIYTDLFGSDPLCYHSSPVAYYNNCIIHLASIVPGSYQPSSIIVSLPISPGLQRGSTEHVSDTGTLSPAHSLWPWRAVCPLSAPVEYDDAPVGTSACPLPWAF